MKSGNWQTFIEDLSHGEELWFEFSGEIYFIQGWYETDKDSFVMTVDKQISHRLSNLWKTESKSQVENAAMLLKEKLFDGKTLEEIENEITQKDGWDMV
ncbi:MAG: hypothetical protein IJ228_02790 [Succinivibrio sp.]|nr:hypothetical protein [Succinivibrio sp.]